VSAGLDTGILSIESDEMGAESHQQQDNISALSLDVGDSASDANGSRNPSCYTRCFVTSCCFLSASSVHPID